MGVQSELKSEDYHQLEMIETIDHSDRDEMEKYDIEETLPEEDLTSTEEGALEAVLFAMGESVDVAKLAQVIDKTPYQTQKILEKMREKYERPESGIMLLELNGSYQLCTKKQYYDDLIVIAKQPKKPQL